MQTVTLNSGRTSTGADSSTRGPQGPSSFTSVVSGTGAVTATVVIQVSGDDTNWLTLGTITLSGTTSASDGFGSLTAWAYVRANVTAISGTSATVVTQMTTVN